MDVLSATLSELRPGMQLSSGMGMVYRSKAAPAVMTISLTKDLTNALASASSLSSRKSVIPTAYMAMALTSPIAGFRWTRTALASAADSSRRCCLSRCSRMRAVKSSTSTSSLVSMKRQRRAGCRFTSAISASMV